MKRADNVIDDFTPGRGNTNLMGGNWYTSSDTVHKGNSFIAPSIVRENGTIRVDFRISPNPDFIPYAAVGTFFNAEQKYVNVHNFSGIEFSYKFNCSNPAMRLEVMTAEVQGSAFLQKPITTPWPDEWAEKKVLFTELKHPPWKPGSAVFSPKNLWGLQFVIYQHEKEGSFYLKKLNFF